MQPQQVLFRHSVLELKRRLSMYYMLSRNDPEEESRLIALETKQS